MTNKCIHNGTKTVQHDLVLHHLLLEGIDDTIDEVDLQAHVDDVGCIQ